MHARWMADDLSMLSGLRTKNQKKRKAEKESGQGKRKKRKEKMEASKRPGAEEKEK